MRRVSGTALTSLGKAETTAARRQERLLLALGGVSRGRDGLHEGDCAGCGGNRLARPGEEAVALVWEVS